MKPGVDPKVDFAFKKVFGSRANAPLLLDLLNAVLKLPVQERLVAIEILNPFEEPETWEGKGSILDIKARDEQGRQYNVEMQMVAAGIFLERVLYYWALVHGKQLSRGDEYDELRPTISISFVNTVLFPEVPDHHLDFRLRNGRHPHLVFSNLHAFHVIELPKFRIAAEELADPLDAWCYFLKHGETLDTDQLPPTLQATVVPRAMEVLQMLTQDEKEWFLYQDRLKAERDYKALVREADRARKEAERAQREIEQAQREIERVQREIDQAQREAEQAQREAEQAQREAEQALAEGLQQGLEKGRQEERIAALIRAIRLYQQLLKRAQTSESELRTLSPGGLQGLADTLERELCSGEF